MNARQHPTTLRRVRLLPTVSAGGGWTPVARAQQRGPRARGPLCAVADSVRLVVRLQHLAGDASAVGHLHLVGPRPFPDSLVLLPVNRCATRRSRRHRALRPTTRAPRGTDELGKRIAQLARIRRGQVDLVRLAVDTKLNGLVGLLAVEIVDQSDLLDLRHRRSPFSYYMEGTTATISGLVERSYSDRTSG